jgi:hypothetical protein
MTTTFTDIEACNRALALFAGGSIQSFTDESSDLSATCATIYPMVRDACLTRRNWYFCKDKRQLALSIDHTPVNEWDNAFVLPSARLSGPVAVFGDGADYPTHDYEIYGDYLCCDYDTVIIDYLKRPDEGEFPEWFNDWLVMETAAALAIPVADQVSKADGFAAEAERKFRNAKFRDSQHEPVKSMFAGGDPLTNTRY